MIISDVPAAFVRSDGAGRLAWRVRRYADAFKLWVRSHAPGRRPAMRTESELFRLNVRCLSGQHPARVAAEQVTGHYYRWQERFTPDELSAVEAVRTALVRLAEEDAPQDKV